MARIDWTKYCNELAKGLVIKRYNVTIRDRDGEIKTCVATKKNIEVAFPRFGIEVISINYEIQD